MANRFWVGGTATWDATPGSKWATTSGGAGGAAVPTVADDVFLDANSGSGVVTTATFGVSACRDLTTTGFTGTLAFSNDSIGCLNFRRNLTIGTATTVTVGAASILLFDGSAPVGSITSNGKTMPGVNANAPGGSLTLNDAFNCAARSVTLNQGTLNTNGQSVTAGSLVSSNSSTRTLTLGSSAISLSGTAAGTWGAGATSNLTVTANTATVTLTGAGGGFTTTSFNWNGLSVVQSGAGASAINGGVPTFANYTRTGTAAKTDTLTLLGVTCTGTFTVTGNSATNRVLVQSSVAGTARTITAAAVSANNADLSDITAAGAASWDLSAGIAGDLGGNTGITFTAALTLYLRGAGTTGFDTASNYSLTSGGGATGRVPLPQDTTRLDASSIASANLATAGSRYGALDTTGYASTMTLGSAATWFGSFTIGSGTTVAGTGTQTLAGRGSKTITTNGKTITAAITVAAVSGTYTLQDAFSSNRSSPSAIAVSSGTFATNAQTVTLSGSTGGVTGTGGTFDATGSAVNLTSSGNTAVVSFTSAASLVGGSWTIASTHTLGWIPWTFSGTGTVTGAPNVTLSGVASIARSFAGGGQTYGALTYTVATSTGQLTITGSNQFAALNVSGGARTLRLTAGTTTNVAACNIFGTAGNLVTIDSSAVGTPAYLAASMVEDTAKPVYFVGDARTAEDAVALGWMALDGTGDYAWSPDHADLDITGDIDLIAKVRLADWTPAIITSLIAKRTAAASGVSYRLGVNTGGTLDLVLSSDSTTAVATASSAATAVTDNTNKWVRATWRNSDDRLQFFLDDDPGTTWPQLGTDRTLAVTGIANTTAVLELGSQFAGTNGLLNGRMYRAIVKDGIGGTTKFDADFADAPATFALDYVSIKDVKATGHGLWYAGSHSTDVSGNDYWSFTDAPSGGVTGTATSVLSGFTQAATGTNEPEYVGSAASTLNAFTQSAAGTRTVPTSTGSAASTLGGFTQAAAGTVTAPVYTGSASSTLTGFAQAATGTRTVPTSTGTASSTLTAFSQSAAGTVVNAGFTGSIASTLQAFDQDATGTRTVPTSTGTAGSVLGTFAQTAAGNYTPGARTGTATSTLAAFSQAATGTRTTPSVTGTAASTLQGFTQSAGGTYTVPIFTGTTASTLAAFTQAAAGGSTVPVYTGTGTSSLAAFSQSGVAVFLPVSDRPVERTLRVPAEPRRLVITAETRLIRVPAEDRVTVIPAENRRVVVPVEPRRLQPAR